MARVSGKNRKRILIVFIALSLLMTGLVLRIAWIQVVRADKYREKAINQQMTDMPLQANRGIIYDRNGKELASSAISYSVWARPSQILKNYTTEEKRLELSKKLAAILGIKAEQVMAKLNSEAVITSIAKYVEKKRCDKIRELKAAGIEISEANKRYYPLGRSAAQLLGSVTDDSVGR